jgi:hypothetical protein
MIVKKVAACMKAHIRGATRLCSRAISYIQWAIGTNNQVLTGYYYHWTQIGVSPVSFTVSKTMHVRHRSTPSTSLNSSMTRPRVPTKDELKQILSYSTDRGKVSIYLMAFSGFRPEVLGDSMGSDGP